MSKFSTTKKQQKVLDGRILSKSPNRDAASSMRYPHMGKVTKDRGSRTDRDDGMRVLRGAACRRRESVNIVPNPVSVIDCSWRHRERRRPSKLEHNVATALIVAAAVSNRTVAGDAVAECHQYAVGSCDWTCLPDALSCGVEAVSD